MRTAHVVAAATLLFSVSARAEVSSLHVYGTGTPGTANVEPRISTFGSAYLGNPQFGVRLTAGLPNSTAFLLVGAQKVDVASSFHINVLPFFVSPPLPTGPSGELIVPLAIPAQPALVGFSAYFQWAVNDPVPAFGISASKGLEAILVDPPRVVTAGSQSATVHPLNTIDPLSGAAATLPQSWTHPGDVEFTRDGTRVVLASETGHAFLIVDAATGNVDKTVSISSSANAVAITPDGTRAYGASYGSGSTAGEIVEIDVDPASPTYGTILGQVALGVPAAQLEGASVSADGKTLAVASLGFSQTSFVVLVDVDPASPTRNSVKNVISGGGLWADVALSPDGSIAYVPQASLGTAGSTLFLYDTATGLPLAVAPGLGNFATDIDITRDGKAVFVATPNSDAISRVEVDPTIPTYLSVTTATSLAKAFSLALSPDESEVWVACQHGPVHRMDAGTLGLLQTFAVNPNAGSGISVR